MIANYGVESSMFISWRVMVGNEYSSTQLMVLKSSTKASTIDNTIFLVYCNTVLQVCKIVHRKVRKMAKSAEEAEARLRVLFQRTALELEFQDLLEEIDSLKDDNHFDELLGQIMTSLQSLIREHRQQTQSALPG